MALAHGLKLKKVHKMLSFEQSKFLESYIMLNTLERAKSTNNFQKNNHKLMNNALFGKFLENERSFRDIKLVSNWDGRNGAKSLIGRPTFKKVTIFSEDLVAIEMLRTNNILKKPFIIGISILEISKLKMYRFHYDFMLKNFSSDLCRVVYGDTDSLVYNIICNDIYKDFIKKNSSEFDTSDYSINNPYNIDQLNKKVIGLMSDENCGEIATEFIGLRSKMYTIKLDKGKVSKRAKGVKKCIISNKITFEDYKKCIFQNCTYINNQSTINSHLHKVYTISTKKKMLDGRDDKRIILNNGINTVAIGHYKYNNSS